jgi:hypothetical protein
MLYSRKYFIKNGFFKKKFNKKTFFLLKKLKYFIERELKKITANKYINLNNFNNYNFDRRRIVFIQIKLKKYLENHKQLHLFLESFIKDIDIISIIGPDISYQKSPWIRIARPNKPEDNIGYHKDTLYGQDTLIPTLHFPLITLPKNGCLNFISGSFNIIESKIKFNNEILFESSVKNSIKHKIGIPYKPKVIKIKNINKFSIKFGEYVFFVPSIIHGQEVNFSNLTRFSIDVRFVNNFYLNSLSDNKKKSFNFKEISNSDLKKLSNFYLHFNK